jgi:hypothetical protein
MKLSIFFNKGLQSLVSLLSLSLIISIHIYTVIRHLMYDFDQANEVLNCLRHTLYHPLSNENLIPKKKKSRFTLTRHSYNKKVE